MKNSVVVAVSTTSLVWGRKLKAHLGIRSTVFSAMFPSPARILQRVPVAPRPSSASALCRPRAHAATTGSSRMTSQTTAAQLNLHYSSTRLITGDWPLKFNGAFRLLSPSCLQRKSSMVSVVHRSCFAFRGGQARKIIRRTHLCFVPGIAAVTPLARKKVKWARRPWIHFVIFPWFATGLVQKGAE